MLCCCRSLRLDVLVGILTALGRWPQYRRPRPTEAWLQAFLVAAEAELAPYLTVTSLSTAAAAAGDETAADVSSSSSQQAAAVLERHKELGDTLPDTLAQMAYMLGLLGMLPSGDWRGKFYLAVSSLLPDFSHVAAANLLHGMAMWMVPLRAQKSAAVAAVAAAGASPDAVAAAGGFSGADYPARLVDALATFAGGPKGLQGLSLASNLVVPQALKAVGWAPDESLVQMNLALISKYLQVGGFLILNPWNRGSYRGFWVRVWQVKRRLAQPAVGVLTDSVSDMHQHVGRGSAKHNLGGALPANGGSVLQPAAGAAALPAHSLHHHTPTSH